MICKPGEIMGLSFPFSDLTSKKRRPVLVLTRTDYRGDFMGLAITSVLTEENAIGIDAGNMTDGLLQKKVGFDTIRYSH